MDPALRGKLVALSDFFVNTKLKTGSLIENSDVWKDNKLEKKEKLIPKLEEAELVPCYIAYARMISGAPLTTAPIGKIMKVLIGYLPNKDGTLIFEEFIGGEKEQINWGQPSAKGEVVNGSTGLEGHDDDNSQTTSASGFVQDVETWINDGDTKLDIKTLLSFHALMSFRVCIKTKKSVKKALSERLIPLCKNLYPNINLNTVIPTVTDSFLDAIKNNMDKGSALCTSLFNMILYCYVQAKTKLSNETISILEAGILKHTQGNGLALINMMFNVHLIYGITLGQLTQMLITTQTYESCERIQKFCATYLLQTSTEMSWWWCRIMDDTQWTSLRISENPVVSVRLAELLIEANPDIMTSYELSKISDGLKAQGRRWARGFKRYMDSLRKDEDACGEAEVILKFMKEDNRSPSVMPNINAILAGIPEGAGLPPSQEDDDSTSS